VALGDRRKAKAQQERERSGFRFGGLTVDNLVADQALQEYADEAHETVLHVLVLQGRGSSRRHSVTCHEKFHSSFADGIAMRELPTSQRDTPNISLTASHLGRPELSSGFLSLTNPKLGEFGKP
jgi:hypothetical protein